MDVFVHKMKHHETTFRPKHTMAAVCECVSDCSLSGFPWKFMKNGAVMCYETCAMNLFAVDGTTIS